VNGPGLVAETGHVKCDGKERTVKRKRYVISGTAAALVLVLAVFSSPKCERKRSALAVVGNEVISGKYHQVQIIENGIFALRARHNFEIIAKSTDYMNAFGSNTLVFRDIARIASKCDRECPQLSDVLDLAARSTQESFRIVELADAACGIRTPDDQARWQARYDQLSAAAIYPSVAAAREAGGQN
jgi:hypothetical protein